MMLPRTWGEAELEALPEGASQIPGRDGDDHRAAGKGNQAGVQTLMRLVALSAATRPASRRDLVGDLDPVEAERLGAFGIRASSLAAC